LLHGHSALCRLLIVLRRNLGRQVNGAEAIFDDLSYEFFTVTFSIGKAVLTKFSPRSKALFRALIDSSSEAPIHSPFPIPHAP
jgi:hypothetical protein